MGINLSLSGRKWDVIDPVRGCQLQQKREPRSAEERIAHRLARWVETHSSQARVLSWKRGATQTCVLRRSATIVFSIERYPRVCCWWRATFAFVLKRDPRVENEIRIWVLEIRLSCLTKDARSVFRLKHDSQVWHEACVWGLVFSHF